MTNIITLLKWLVACLTSGLLLTACSKEKHELPAPVTGTTPTIQFAQEAYSVAESAEPLTITLALSEPAKQTSEVAVLLSSTTAAYGTDFITEPATANGELRVPVVAGRREATLLVKPINNNTRQATRQLLLAIKEEGAIKPGARKQTEVMILDDESSSAVNFSSATVSVTENQAAGVDVELTVTPAAAAAGFVELDLTLTNAVYGQHFTTVPAAVNKKLTLQVPTGATKIGLRVQPIDDNVYNPTRTLMFRMSRFSPELLAGQQNSFRLSITDNDAAAPPTAPTSIAALRGGYNGTASYFWADIIIAGTVTSVTDNIGATTAFIEDGTGGIALRFSSNHSLRAGEIVAVSLQGAELARGSYGLEIRQLSTSAVQRTGTEIFVAPETSLAALYASTQSWEGQLVVLRNVRFTEANGVQTYEGDRTISDGQHTATVRTSGSASFRNNVVPAQAVSITGILIRQNGRYIILPLTGNSIQ